ncbi:copper amine oxidase N-terminal domain-containing protein [Paenibacillus rigui]|uniref:Copper amine oxidase-like N-terminal domain-containing protein n=1 Tax=Paenibacillus rigui TaxID=554312 RepID=A0A229UU26_9BACL|nr:copper amine oxidase N-terminal domain-containing protein [Paenibacillus rigui]OXM86665.1 hypothetical protein CF651_09465 [Paenibacillus rigui]
MGKRALIGVAIAAGAFGFALHAYSESDIKLFVNGKSTETSVELINDTSYIPLRAVSEMLGAQVSWDDGTRSISITGPFPTDEKEEYSDGNIKFYHVKTKQTELGWEITADIANADGHAYKAINFTAVFTDDKHAILGRASGTVYHLDSGQTKNVQFVTSDDVSGYSSIQFQKDFSY